MMMDNRVVNLPSKEGRLEVLRCSCFVVWSVAFSLSFIWVSILTSCYQPTLEKLTNG